jgi:AcrR family transcriptional regulator
LSDTPQGDAQERLILAVLSLLPQKPADALSVRDIAAEAGVNHGLVHRHFGSKEALLREAIARVSGQVHGESRGDQPSTWAWRLVRDRPELVRILARVCLDGPKDLLPLAVPPPERLEEYGARWPTPGSATSTRTS